MSETPTVTQVLKDIPKGQFFSVLFEKRTNGEIRKMQCRTGVHKHLKGGELKYSPNEKGLITVWSPDSAGKHGQNDVGYRAVPIYAITEIHASGKVWKFIPTE